MGVAVRQHSHVEGACARRAPLRGKRGGGRSPRADLPTTQGESRRRWDSRGRSLTWRCRCNSLWRRLSIGLVERCRRRDSSNRIERRRPVSYGWRTQGFVVRALAAFAISNGVKQCGFLNDKRSRRCSPTPLCVLSSGLPVSFDEVPSVLLVLPV